MLVATMVLFSTTTYVYTDNNQYNNYYQVGTLMVNFVDFLFFI